MAGSSSVVDFRRAGRLDDAAAAYRRAHEQNANDAERDFLAQQLAVLLEA